MFNRLKDRAKITDQDPAFKARYIGSSEIFTASGRGCTTAVVQKLWDNSKEERYLKRVQLKMTCSGIQMKHLDKKKEDDALFPIENISFCNVDTLVNDHLFSWICSDPGDKLLQCHAVFCSSSQKAKAMSLVLSRAFQIAYKEWKSSQLKVKRDSENYHRSQSLPTLSFSRRPVGESRVLSKQHSVDPSMNNGVVSAKTVSDIGSAIPHPPSLRTQNSEDAPLTQYVEDSNSNSKDILIQAHM